MKVMEIVLLSLDEAYFNNSEKAFACSFYEDVRPLTGTASKLDWCLRGLMSNFLKAGKIGGQEGELTYLPVLKFNTVHHIFLLGLGKSEKKIGTKHFLNTSFKNLMQTLEKLKLKSIILSQSSFPFVSTQEISNLFKNFSVEFTQ